MTHEYSREELSQQYSLRLDEPFGSNSMCKIGNAKQVKWLNGKKLILLVGKV